MSSVKRRLIYIPYQDMYNFINDGILTREYSVFHYLCDSSVEICCFINKPRTKLDGKKINFDESRFPDESIENDVKKKIMSGETFFPGTVFDINELILRRGWWTNAYVNALDNFKQLDWNNQSVVVYSNNPYAYRLISKLKDLGAKIIFDAMDNLCTFPMLKRHEQEIAFRGYGEMAKISDFFSCNSVRTQTFMTEYFGRTPVLIKNGVHKIEKSLSGLESIPQIQEIRSKKDKYTKVVGYIGKFGPKMDVELIKKVCKCSPELLFVLVGFDVSKKGDFVKSVSGIRNLICLPGVASAYIYSIMNEFDVLSIPYQVGKNENSGDPLKLYQYMMTGKPILSTPIQEVDEFSEYIHILATAEEWIEFLKQSPSQCDYSQIAENFLWEKRLKPMLDFYHSIEE